MARPPPTRYPKTPDRPPPAPPPGRTAAQAEMERPARTRPALNRETPPPLRASECEIETPTRRGATAGTAPARRLAELRTAMPPPSPLQVEKSGAQVVQPTRSRSARVGEAESIKMQPPPGSVVSRPEKPRARVRPATTVSGVSPPRNSSRRPAGVGPPSSTVTALPAREARRWGRPPRVSGAGAGYTPGPSQTAAGRAGAARAAAARAVAGEAQGVAQAPQDGASSPCGAGEAKNVKGAVGW